MKNADDLLKKPLQVQDLKQYVEELRKRMAEIAWPGK
jgi:hypothetical protein